MELLWVGSKINESRDKSTLGRPLPRKLCCVLILSWNLDVIELSATT